MRDVVVFPTNGHSYTCLLEAPEQQAEFTVLARLGPGPSRVGSTACNMSPEPCAPVLTWPHSYSPGWEYTVPTSILKDPTRVPLRSRFLEWITFQAEPPASNQAAQG